MNSFLSLTLLLTTLILGHADENVGAKALRRRDLEVQREAIVPGLTTTIDLKNGESEDALTLDREWDRGLASHAMSMPPDGTLVPSMFHVVRHSPPKLTIFGTHRAVSCTCHR